MSLFTTRVELYGNASWADFDNLHAAMEKVKFYRTIKYQGAKESYQLPHAEYNISSELDTDDIRDLAVKAASTAWADFGVLVTKSDGPRRWHNLKPV